MGWKAMGEEGESMAFGFVSIGVLTRRMASRTLRSCRSLSLRCGGE